MLNLRAVAACFLALTLAVGACRGDTGTLSQEPSTSTVELTIETVLTWIDEWYGAAPAGGSCGDSGPVAVGGVFACGGTPPTTGPTDYSGTVIYVIDETGRAAWTSGTDVPGPTTDLLRNYQRVPKGLFCRDLLSPATDAFPFSSNRENPKAAYFWSLVYWSLEGKPDRMDADLDGVPCETLYDADIIAGVLDGGPVG